MGDLRRDCLQIEGEIDKIAIPRISTHGTCLRTFDFRDDHATTGNHDHCFAKLHCRLVPALKTIIIPASPVYKSQER